MSNSDANFRIEIETEADLKRLEDYQRDLKRVEEAAKEVGAEHDKITDQLKKVEQQLGSTEAKALKYEAALKKLKEVHGGGEEFEKQLYSLEQAMAQIGGRARMASEGVFKLFNSVRGFENLGEVIGNLASNGILPVIGAAAAGVGALEMLRKSVEEFMHAEDAMAKVDASLAQKGLLSEDFRAKIQALSGELSDQTKIAEDQWLPVMARLLQFGADDTNLEQYTESVKNLAGIMGGDIEQASHIFTRVMGGNVEFLRRYGIHVAQGETSTETLNNAMQAIAQKGGGQLEAMAETLSGRMRGLKNSMNEVFENIGKQAGSTGLLQGALELFTDVVDVVKDHVAATIPVLHGLSNGLGSEKVRDAAEAWSQFQEEQERLKESQEGILKGQQDELALATKLLGIDKQIAEEKKKQQEMEINRKEAAKEITHEEAARQKAVLEGDTRGMAIANQRQEANAKFTAVASESDQKLKNAYDAEARYNKIKEEANKVDKERESKMTNIKLLHEQQAKLNEAEASVASEQNQVDTFTKSGAIPALPGVEAITAIGAIGAARRLKQAQDKRDQAQKNVDMLSQAVGPMDEKGQPAVDPPEITAKKREEAKKEMDKAFAEAREGERKREAAKAEHDAVQRKLTELEEAQQATDTSKGEKEVEAGAKKDENDRKKAAQQTLRKIEQENKARGLKPGHPAYQEGGMPEAAGESDEEMTTAQVLNPMEQYHNATADVIKALGNKYQELTNQMTVLEERINNDRLV